MLLSVIGIFLLLKVLVNFLGLVNEPIFEDIISCRKCVKNIKSFFTLSFLYSDFYPINQQIRYLPAGANT